MLGQAEIAEKLAQRTCAGARVRIRGMAMPISGLRRALAGRFDTVPRRRWLHSPAPALRGGARFGAALVCTFASAAIVLSACANSLGCDLDGISRDLGGAGLMDCGIASDDTSNVDACAVTAFRMRSTFRAIYEQPDGSLQAIVHAAGDSYYLLRASKSGDSVERADCQSASLASEGTRQFVQCEKPSAFREACD